MQTQQNQRVNLKVQVLFATKKTYLKKDLTDIVLQARFFFFLDLLDGIMEMLYWNLEFARLIIREEWSRRPSLTRSEM